MFLRNLPFLIAFTVSSAVIWAPDGLIHYGQRKTNATAKPVIAQLICLAHTTPCP